MPKTYIYIFLLLNPLLGTISYGTNVRVRIPHERPRLYVDTQTVASLAQKIEDSEVGSIYRKLEERIGAGVTHTQSPIPKACFDLAQKRRTLNSLKTELFPTYNLDLEHMANDLAEMVFAYRLSIARNSNHSDLALAKAKSSIQCILRYDDPTHLPWGVSPVNTDLAAGQLLFALSLALDGLYNVLDQNTLHKMKSALSLHGEIMYQAAKPVRKGERPKTGWNTGNKGYLQNHLWIAERGLAAAAFALYSPAYKPRVQRWINQVVHDLRVTQSILSSDGASQEGVHYWGYGMAALISLNDMVEKFVQLPLFHWQNGALTSWWKKTAYYRINMSLPSGVWDPSFAEPASEASKAMAKQNVVADFADNQNRSDDYSHAVLHRLASLTGNGVAQWLANQLISKDVAICNARWLDLLWYNEKVLPVDPSQPQPSPFPSLYFAKNIGMIAARNNWTPTASAVFFKSGPPMGHGSIARGEEKFLTYFSSSAGHAHPDANTFSIFGGGRWLMRNSGYTFTKKTRYENSLTIDDGVGQIGETPPESTARWFDASRNYRVKPTLKIKETGPLDHTVYMIGDATTAYPASAGIRAFKRHLVYLKEMNTVLVVDAIETDGEKDRTLFLSFHPEVRTSDPVQDPANNNWIWTSDDEKVKLRVTSFDDSVGVKTVTTPMKMHCRDSLEARPAIKIGKIIRASNVRSDLQWFHATGFTWSDTDEELPTITLDKSSALSEDWRFTVKKGSATQTVTVNPTLH